MKNFKINEEDLKSFAIKIYQEACYGYFDLAESFVETALQDFLKNCVLIKDGLGYSSNIYETQNSSFGGTLRQGVFDFDSNNFVQNNSLNTNLGSVTISSVPTAISALASPSGQFNEGEGFSSTVSVNTQQNTSIENYQGNESERF
jgi:hypothetical protein